MAVASTLTGPLTFVQYMQRINEPRVITFWEAFIKQKSIPTYLSIETEEALIKRGRRVIDKLPKVTALPMGAEPTTPFTTTNQPFQETLMLNRDNNDLDRLYRKDKNYIAGDPSMIDIKLYIQARNMFVNNYFFNNSTYQGPTSDPNGFIGVRYRCLDAINGNTGNYGVNPAVVFQASGAINSTSRSATNAINIEQDFDRMFQHMDAENGEGLVAFCSPQFMWLFDALLKAASTSGGLATTKDQFERKVRKYGECEFVSCGLLPPLDGGLQTAPNISSGQDVNGWQAGDNLYNPTGTTYFTSVIFVSKDPNKFTCWQQEDPYMEKEQIPGTRKVRTMLDQTLGIFMQDTRGIGMLYGIQVNGPASD